MSMALVILGLLINVGLLIRIRYGREVITNLTYRPYIVSLALLIVMFAQILCSEIGIVIHGEIPDYDEDGAVLYYSISIISSIKYILVVTLIMVRGFENAALSNFVCFQRN